MPRGGRQLVILVPIVALLGAGAIDLWAVVRAHAVLARAMIQACRDYELSDGPAEGALPQAAATRFEGIDGRPARFRAHAVDGGVRLAGSVRTRPPFGLLGQELHVGHTVWFDLRGAPPAPSHETSQPEPLPLPAESRPLDARL